METPNPESLWKLPSQTFRKRSFSFDHRGFSSVLLDDLDVTELGLSPDESRRLLGILGVLRCFHPVEHFAQGHARDCSLLN